jgi:hypothetical protein
MSEARLTTAIRVSALIRRVNADGGSATVLAKGDPTAGALLLLLCERGANPRLYERALSAKGRYLWQSISLNLLDNPENLAAFIEKRRRIDPDLWVVELDVAEPERFIDEPFMNG